MVRNQLPKSATNAAAFGAIGDLLILHRMRLPLISAAVARAGVVLLLSARRPALA